MQSEVEASPTRALQEVQAQAQALPLRYRFETLFARIEESLLNQCSIGFMPDQAAEHGKFHKLKLAVKDRTMTVRSRDGYYSD